MTNTPVKDVGFGQKGLMPVSGVQNRVSGDFQSVWNNQRSEKSTDSQTSQNFKPVKKTSYDSAKVRDEHRARTQKREPSRNVEERTDIPEEETAEVLASSAVLQNQPTENPVMEEIPAEAVQLLEEMATEAVAQIAGAFGMTESEVREAMSALGMDGLDVLDPGDFGELLMAVAGEKDAAALVTDEELYGKYRSLMEQLDGMLGHAAEELGTAPEQLSELSARVQALQADGAGDNRAEADKGMNGLLQDEAQPTVEENVGNRELPSAGEASGFPEKAGEEMNFRSGEQAAKKEHSHRDDGEGANLFAQGLRADQSADRVQQPTTAESSFSPDTQNIMRQIMDYMRVSLRSDMSSLEMQLHPANLGTLHVQVASKDGVVTASFITQNEAVKAALEGQMIQLKEQFAEQGVRVEAIEVTVQTHQFEQNLEQGRGNGGQGQEPSKRGRIRRINTMEEAGGEEMEEEDLLVRDIMEQNGNTVDYTA